MATHLRPEGRRLVSTNGDKSFELSADIRNFEVPFDSDDETEQEYVLSFEGLVIRVWCQKAQQFVVLALSEHGRLVAEAHARTNKEAMVNLMAQVESL